jgi:hypothetical protein
MTKKEADLRLMASALAFFKAWARIGVIRKRGDQAQANYDAAATRLRRAAVDFADASKI